MVSLFLFGSLFVVALVVCDCHCDIANCIISSLATINPLIVYGLVVTVTDIY